MQRRREFLTAAGSFAVGTTAGCTAVLDAPQADVGVQYELRVDHPTAPDGELSAPSTPPPTEVETTVLVENLAIPWDLAFAGTGEAFVTERTGRIRRFESGEVSAFASPTDVVDAGAVEPGSEEREWWVEGGEGGLLGIAVHPRYPDVPAVYAYYTYRDGPGRANKVVAFDAAHDEPARATRTVVDGIPGANIHDGGRIAFGPRNYLWITTGDAGEESLAQDPTSLGGKVLRVTPAGDPAPDNPAATDPASDDRADDDRTTEDVDLGPDADPRIFSLGHRNPQGVAWLPDGTPVVTEHGPGGHDEVSVLVPGGNYGWPTVREPDEYRASEFRRPVLSTERETWAPSGCIFYTGDAISGLRDRLLVGTLTGGHLAVVTLAPAGDSSPPPDDGEGGADDGETAGDPRRFDDDWLDDRYAATAHRLLDDDLGRIRLVTGGPDGSLYAITSNRDNRAQPPFPTARDDVLVRIDPA